jgi:hypothetical protein
MDIAEAAQRMGMKAFKEVVDVVETPDGHVVTTHDGFRTLIHPDGAMTFGVPEPDVEVVEEISEVEAQAIAEHVNRVTEAGDDDVPDGTANEIMEWVGEDIARGERALAVELKRDPQRSTLVAKLSNLLARLGAQG